MLATRTVHATMDDRATAFSTLLDRGLDARYRLAAVILGDPFEAEDAVHDAAVQAWRSFASLRDPDRFDAWFARILVNQCRDRLRARKRRPVVHAIAELADRRGPIAPAGHEPHGQTIRRDEIERALTALDADHAIVVVLRFYLDLTVPEIADRLGIPDGTVKSRLHHALRRLRTAVGEPEETQR